MNRRAMVSVLAVAFSLGLAGCSSATPTGGGFPGDGTQGNNSTSSGGGSAVAASSSGAAAASSSGGGSSSSGTNSSTGSSGSSGGGSNDDASTGGSSGTNSSGGDGGSGGPMPSHGCGQGTSCTPASDLAPPAAGDGVQFVLQSGQVTIQPNTEAYYCYYKTLPGNTTTQVGAFQSWMSTGASHHFITFQGTGGMADGALSQCSIGTGKWVYATSVSGQIIELKMPDNVGLSMPAGTQLILNMHFVNPNSTPVSPVLKLNVLFAKNVQYQAATMVSFNAGISVPPGGTQTVTGSCSAPVGSKFFAVTTHTHKNATNAKVNFVAGGMVTNVANTTDWESPDVGLFYAPNFLTVNSGDSFTYSCSYKNSGTQTITVGETAAFNEMCMAIGYFFPAGTASCN